MRFRVRRVERPPYIIDEGRLRRYDQRNLIFNRVYNDPSWGGYGRGEEERALENMERDRRGYSRVDYALVEASWTVHDGWLEAFSWDGVRRPRGPSVVGKELRRGRHSFGDLEEATRIVRRAARFFGASLVGVAEVNPLWLYANRRHTLEPLELPEEVRWAVVMALEMEEVGIAASPACPAAAATGLGYSKMAFTATCLAEFIRCLGYRAIPSGNDTALSIPLAIDAGLGQLGRNGLLITPEYGPRVRICKVFTDLPLKSDSPIDFGVTEFCRRCRRCAEACEAEAISMDPEQSWEPACRSNNPGALKWYVDAEKCYEFWCENGSDCSTCIAVCPFNPGRGVVDPGEFWDGSEASDGLGG